MNNRFVSNWLLHYFTYFYVSVDLVKIAFCYPFPVHTSPISNGGILIPFHPLIPLISISALRSSTSIHFPLKPDLFRRNRPQLSFQLRDPFLHSTHIRKRQTLHSFTLIPLILTLSLPKQPPLNHHHPYQKETQTLKDTLDHSDSFTPFPSQHNQKHTTTEAPLSTQSSPSSQLLFLSTPYPSPHIPHARATQHNRNDRQSTRSPLPAKT